MVQANLNPDVQRRHNARNTLHTLTLVAASAAILGLLAYSVYGVTGLIGAAILGAFMVQGLSQVSPKLVLNLYKARVALPGELPELQQALRSLAKRADLPTVPQLYIVPSQLMNAFAVGNRQDSAIAVTDALVTRMNLRQMTGILGHETAHIMNGDLRVMGLADVLARITGLMSTFGLMGLPLVFGMNVHFPVLGLLAMIFAPTLTGLVQLGLSRAREYDADLDGVTLTGDPDGLVSALRVLEAQQGRPWEGIFLPGGRVPNPSLLRTHPATEDRIARLHAVRQTAMPDPIQADMQQPLQPSFVPRVRRPQVQWHRLGVYF
ncbi:MAG: zinc metalloprotease HtpX [Hyphomicrobiales bacterium]